MKVYDFITYRSWLMMSVPALIVFLAMRGSFSFAANDAVTRGAALAQACMTCHGPEGQSVGAIPSLKGVPAPTLRATLLAYRSGERSGTVMSRLARGLADADIEAVSSYFSTPPRR